MGHRFREWPSAGAALRTQLEWSLAFMIPGSLAMPETVSRGCIMGQVQQVAKHAFAELVERAAACDRIRGVLALLKRYESLFRLPTRIRHASERGAYDQARLTC